MDCLFCRIVAGEIASRQVRADEVSVSFLDIAPWQRGHTLVVPRRHTPDLTSDPQVFAGIAPSVAATAELLVERLGADGVNMLVNSGPVAGQEVFHLHVHLVPRYAAEPGLDAMIRRGREFDLDQIWDEIRT